jgi:hypothetical protein
MSSLAEDVTWYAQFQRAAEAGSQPIPATNRAAPSTERHRKPGILRETLSNVLPILPRASIDVLPTARTLNGPSEDCYELPEPGTANREFHLKLLEWNRRKMMSCAAG